MSNLRLVLTLLSLGILMHSSPSMAREHHGGRSGAKDPSLRNTGDEQYEAGLADTCNKQEEERQALRKIKKIAYYSEECLPIEVDTRKMKRDGELKHAAVCDQKRHEERAHAENKEKIRLLADCFNLIPDTKIDVEMDEPADPIYRIPQDGFWKNVRFFSCPKKGACSLVSEKIQTK